MRRVRYMVAMSLDDYIAGPNGEADWIIMVPEIDFRALFEQFDTFLLGRRTFESIGGAAGVVRGMVLGDRALIPEDLDEAFQRSGITHILPPFCTRSGGTLQRPAGWSSILGGTGAGVR
jgi:hypothetical protein